MDILVYKDGIVTDAGTITKENSVWKIKKPDGTETFRVGDDFTKYTVDSIPNDYKDFKYYYRGFFELNVLYYHNETNQKLKENQERIESLETENTKLGDTLDDILTNVIPTLIGESEVTSND